MKLYICYLPDRRFGWEETVPELLKTARARRGLGPFSKARAQFLPIRTDATPSNAALPFQFFLENIFK